MMIQSGRGRELAYKSTWVLIIPFRGKKSGFGASLGGLQVHSRSFCGIFEGIEPNKYDRT